MDAINISPNECVICRRDTFMPDFTDNLFSEQNWFDTGRYDCPPTSAEHESCLLRFLQVTEPNISKIQNDTANYHFQAANNLPQIIASSYCKDCCRRNHEIFDLVTQIYKLNVRLGRLRELVKTDFRDSFSLGDGMLFDVNAASEIILQRKKSVRYEIAIAAGLRVMSSQREEEPFHTDAYYSGDEMNDYSPEIVQIVLESDPEVYDQNLQKNDQSEQTTVRITPEIKTEPKREVAKKRRGKRSIAQLKKVHHVQECSVHVQRLPADILPGVPIDVNALNPKILEPKSRRVTRSKPDLCRIFDGLDQILAATGSCSESSFIPSSGDEFLEEPLDTLPETAVKARKPRRHRKKKPEVEGGNEPRFYCAIEGCLRKNPFRSADSLECHNKKVHLGIPKPYQCPECDQTYAEPHSRSRHMNQMHLKVGLHICEICGKSFPDMTTLNVHMVAHSGERPVQCEECGGTFKRISALNAHVRRVHRNERPFKCDQCGKDFYTSFKLKNHVNSVHLKHERPFVCEICGKGFPVQGYLYMHKRGTHKIGVPEEPEETLGDEAGNGDGTSQKKKPKRAPRKRKKAGGPAAGDILRQFLVTGQLSDEPEPEPGPSSTSFPKLEQSRNDWDQVEVKSMDLTRVDAPPL